MLKRTFAILLIMATVFCIGGVAFAATGDVEYDVLINGEATELRAFMRNGEVYVEARRALEAFGWVVFWNAKTSQIAANSRDGELFVHTLPSSKAEINGATRNFARSSVMIDYTAYFPLPMLTALAKTDSVFDDTGARELLLYKTFKAADKTAQRILQQVALVENYNPLNFREYIKYANANASVAANKVILYINIGVHIPPYSDIKYIANPNDAFVVVDKNHRFADDFTPNLTLVDGYYWVKEAGEAWVAMKAAAKADGITLNLNNTYRNVATQTYNYNRKVQAGRKVAEVDKMNARPGHSEHHTGYAADLAGIGQFVGSKAHSWVIQNGYKYGFIISFQAGKEFINNYSPEGWHVRWFPEWAAKIMYEENLTIQEFENLYVNPTAHGFAAVAAVAKSVAETDFVAKRNLKATAVERAIDVDGTTMELSAFKIGSEDYFKLRDIAVVLSDTEKRFGIDWDSEREAVVIVRGESYDVPADEQGGKSSTVAPRVLKLSVDGVEYTFSAYNIAGSNYLKLRDIGTAVGFEVDWGGARGAIETVTENAIDSENGEDSADGEAELDADDDAEVDEAQSAA